MKIIKYFIEFVIIIFLFCVFKLLGLKNASNFGSILGRSIGPFFRSKKIIKKNLNFCFKDINSNEINRISNLMWENIGRTFSEYVFLKNFRKKDDLVKINGLEHLEEIKKKMKKLFLFLHILQILN